MITTRTLAVAVLLLAGCGDDDADVSDGGVDAARTDAGTDAGAPDAGDDAASHDPGLVSACRGCHPLEIEAFRAHPSSHSLLFACTTCHATNWDRLGPGHATRAACRECHSTGSHATAEEACTRCHDPHGSSNVFLVRERITLPDGSEVPVSFVRPEGASPYGLARAGVLGQVAGTGLCEVCHTATRFFDRAATGAPHDGAFCGDCHDHELGFHAPAP